MPRQPVNTRAILASIWLTFASLVAVALLYSIRHLLFHIVIAAFLALVLNGPVDWLCRHGVRRSLAILAVVTIVVLGVLGVAASIAAPLASQGATVARRAPEYLRLAQQGRGPLFRAAHRFHLESQLSKAGPLISRSLSRLSTQAIDLGRAVVSAAFSTFLTLILMIFLLVEGPALVAALRRLTPPAQREAAKRIGRHVAATVSSYTVGILLLGVLNGLVTAGALEATRVPFVLPLAMWAGVVDIMPIIGGLLAMLVVAVFAFAKSVLAGIVVMGVMLVYQQVKNHLLYPVVVGRAVQLNALVVLVSVLAGAEMAGITGALLAIPVAAIIHVAITELIGPRVPWMMEEPPTGKPRDARSRGLRLRSGGPKPRRSRST